MSHIPDSLRGCERFLETASHKCLNLFNESLFAHHIYTSIDALSKADEWVNLRKNRMEGIASGSDAMFFT